MAQVSHVPRSLESSVRPDRHASKQHVPDEGSPVRHTFSHEFIGSSKYYSFSGCDIDNDEEIVTDDEEEFVSDDESSDGSFPSRNAYLAPANESHRPISERASERGPNARSSDWEKTARSHSAVLISTPSNTSGFLSGIRPAKSDWGANGNGKAKVHYSSTGEPLRPYSSDTVFHGGFMEGPAIKVLSNSSPLDVKPTAVSVNELYKPLDPDQQEIRILVLDDATIGESSPNAEKGCPQSSHILRFRLETVSLLDPRLRYEAVSWCWGEYQDTIQIDLNGHLTPVWTSAESTLRALCTIHGHKYVWMDAICINQGDIVEKAEQINMMGKIYSRADRTLVWLGHAPPEPMLAVQALYEALDSMLPAEWVLSDRSTLLDFVLKNFPVNPTSISRAWSDIYSFFSNGWFTRVWIIQEVKLAREIVLHQGSQMLEWDSVTPVARWLSNRSDLPSSDAQRDAKVGYHNCDKICRLGDPEKRFKFANLMQQINTFKATIPADMVYALLGMRRKSVQEQGVHSRIKVDYRDAESLVFAAATKAAIEESKSLDVLQHVCSLRPRDENLCELAGQGFASWAFRLDRGRESFTQSIGGMHFSWHADHRKPLKFWHKIETRQIKVEGVVYDKVAHVSPLIDSELYLDDGVGITTAAIAFHEALAWTHEQLPELSEYRLAEKFAMTAAAGQDAQSRRILNSRNHSHRLREGFSNLMHITEVDIMKSKHDAKSSRTSQKAQHFAADLFQHDPHVAYALKAMVKSAHGKTLFVTESGSLGLGTHNTMAGDTVCILFGGTVPFLLRTEREHWRQFVGGAFVEEIMEGEHIRNLEAAGRLHKETKTFTII